MCDFRTVDRKDLIPADIIFPHYQDEAYEVLYNPDQKWFYKKGMDWDDVLLFKLGDNLADEAPCKLALRIVDEPPEAQQLTSIKCVPIRLSWTPRFPKTPRVE